MVKRSKSKKVDREKVEIVLLLFEGQSDEDALYIPIANIFEAISEKIDVYPIFIQDQGRPGGDITSKYGVKPEKIEKLIGELAVNPFLRNHGLYPKHINRIIQFVDMDGAYIQDTDIIQQTDKSIEDVLYFDKIVAPDVEEIIDRNKRKRANLDYLSTLNKIKIESKTIDYSVFYFSSNIDHVLHDNANLADSLKRNAAQEFQLFNSEMNRFKSFFVTKGLTSGCDNYEESWGYIKKGNNSLSRKTNIDILIDSLMKEIT